MVGRCKHTERLYRLEEKRDEVLEKIAVELEEIHRMKEQWEPQYKDVHWGMAVPQALFDVLNSWESGAAAIAASAFLEEYVSRFGREDACRGLLPRPMTCNPCPHKDECFGNSTKAVPA
jgi:hypothetical protein